MLRSEILISVQWRRRVPYGSSLHHWSSHVDSCIPRSSHIAQPLLLSGPLSRHERWIQCCREVVLDWAALPILAQNPLCCNPWRGNILGYTRSVSQNPLCCKPGWGNMLDCTPIVSQNSLCCKPGWGNMLDCTPFVSQNPLCCKPGWGNMLDCTPIVSQNPLCCKPGRGKFCNGCG